MFSKENCLLHSSVGNSVGLPKAARLKWSICRGNISQVKWKLSPSSNLYDERGRFCHPVNTLPVPARLSWWTAFGLWWLARRNLAWVPAPIDTQYSLQPGSQYTVAVRPWLAEMLYTCHVKLKHVTRRLTSFFFPERELGPIWPQMYRLRPIKQYKSRLACRGRFGVAITACFIIIRFHLVFQRLIHRPQINKRAQACTVRHCSWLENSF